MDMEGIAYLIFLYNLETIVQIGAPTPGKSLEKRYNFGVKSLSPIYQVQHTEV